MRLGNIHHRVIQVTSYFNYLYLQYYYNNIVPSVNAVFLMFSSVLLTISLRSTFEGSTFCALSEILYQKLGIVLFALEIEDLRKDKSSTRLLLNPAGELYTWALFFTFIVQFVRFGKSFYPLFYIFSLYFRLCDSAEGRVSYWSLRNGQKQSTGMHMFNILSLVNVVR